jgi:16S rRNA C1402 N4-methylase RsmH
VVGRKPIVPSEEETRRNPASRSARLRVLEFEKDFSK